MKLCPPIVAALLGVTLTVTLPGIAAADDASVSIGDVPSTDQPIRIDGHLDDAAWANALKIDMPYQFSPVDQPQAPVPTEAYLISNRSTLFIAFHAHDPDPSAIRAHLADRDTAFHDDFVGLMLDTFNDKRRAYEFIANPLGVQSDLFRNDLSGEEDPSFDAIWDSAGRITDDGYVVEMAIPFRQMRFRDGGTVKHWGLILFRTYPRDVRHQLSNVAIDTGKSCLICQEQSIAGFKDATPGHDLQITPTLTGIRTQSRDARNAPLDGNGLDTQAGLDIHWGVTPNTTVSATLNPDFSTIESDVLQLDVNNQFTLSYDERRPFFLDGADHFKTLETVVYTRNIADPDYGVKLTGHTGRNSYGAFTAQDSLTNVIFPGVQSNDYGSYQFQSRGSVGRYQRDVGRNSTLGVIATDRRGADYHNTVTGADGQLRFNDNDQLNVQLLHSSTQYDPRMLADIDGLPSGTFSDTAYYLQARHDTKHVSLYSSYENFGDRFRADLGFIPQVGYKKLTAGGGYEWIGDDSNWYVQHGFSGEWGITHDQNGNILERQIEGYYHVKAGLQSYLELGGVDRDVSYQGRLFNEQFVTLYAEYQPSGSLFPRIFLKHGHAIDYKNTQLGTLNHLEPSLTWQLGKHLKAEFSGGYETLDVDAGRLYTARISDLRLYYQFSVRTQVRLITQYQDVTRAPQLYTDSVDAHSRNWASQVLFSYKVNPQTVIYAGYANGYQNDDQRDSLFINQRTVFFKLSYAWQI